MMLLVELLIDGVCVEKPQEIADHLNSHFVKAGLVNEYFIPVEKEELETLLGRHEVRCRRCDARSFPCHPSW